MIEDYSYSIQREQIFTAGMYGCLTRISVYLENDPINPATTPIIVSIQSTTDHGLAYGKEIERGEIPVDKIPAYGSVGPVGRCKYQPCYKQSCDHGSRHQIRSSSHPL